MDTEKVDFLEPTGGKVEYGIVPFKKSTVAFKHTALLDIIKHGIEEEGDRGSFKESSELQFWNIQRTVNYQFGTGSDTFNVL